jgi:hypothetical protein
VTAPLLFWVRLLNRSSSARSSRSRSETELGEVCSFGSDLVPRIALAHAGHDLRQGRHVDDERWSGYLTEE